VRSFAAIEVFAIEVIAAGDTIARLQFPRERFDLYRYSFFRNRRLAADAVSQFLITPRPPQAKALQLCEPPKTAARPPSDQ